MTTYMPFWDEARTGELCAVPCWPSDLEGNAVDCEGAVMLLGVLGEDGLFRAEEAAPFNPAEVTYVCRRH